MPGSDAMRQERRPAPSEATQLAREWMSAFSAALDRRDIDSAARLFNDECYWRDLVTFTWNIKTMEGHSSIVAMLTKTLADVRPRSWLIDGEAKIVDGIIEAWFTFETGVALGRGHLRLRNAAGRC
jgi:putative flavoprotein involved in K+ transport